MHANDFGVFDGLVTVLPTLGKAGAAHLTERLTKVLKDRSAKAGDRDHQTLVHALLFKRGGWPVDVDAYIARVPMEERPALPSRSNRPSSSRRWPGRRALAV